MRVCIIWCLLFHLLYLDVVNCFERSYASGTHEECDRHLRNVQSAMADPDAWLKNTMYRR
jgi:hypothetical protein